MFLACLWHNIIYEDFYNNDDDYTNNNINYLQIAIPATGALIGTPAAIKDKHPAQILA